MGAMRGSWTRPLAGLSPRASGRFWAASFLGPLALWCAVSYLPFLWHPMVRVSDPGDSAWLTPGELVDKAAFAGENGEIAARARAGRRRGARPTRSFSRRRTRWRARW